MTALRAALAWLLKPFDHTPGGMEAPVALVLLVQAALIFLQIWDVVVHGNSFDALAFGGAEAGLLFGGGAMGYGMGNMIRSRASTQRDADLEGM